MSQIPTVGRIVLYRLSSYDADQINRRRTDALAHLSEHQDRADGSQIHVGNQAAAGDEYPMVVVRAWGDTPESAVNGQVLLDGNDTYWATSRHVGDQDGEWRWPERV